MISNFCLQIKEKIYVADIHTLHIDRERQSQETVPEDCIEDTSEQSEDDDNAIYAAIPYINSDRDSYTTIKSSISRVSMASSVKSFSSSEICFYRKKIFALNWGNLLFFFW